MKLGIVGTGTIVKEALPVIVKIKEIECKVICGTQRSKETAKELCSQYDIPDCVTDFTQMLASDIDAVYVAVPNHLHYSFCLDALNAGKNVIVEKPLASNYSEASSLAEAARENNLFFFEAINTVYLPNYIKIMELLPHIGEVKLVQCNFSQYSSRYDAFQAGRVLPVFDPAKSGGALMDINLYNVHYVMDIFGAPQKAAYYPNMERGIDTSGILLMNYPGFQAVCLGAKDCGAPSACVIQGTKGYILQNSPANACSAVTLHLNDGTEHSFDENGGSHRMAAEFIAFARQIASGDRTSCYKMLDQSLAVSRVITEARLAAGIRFGPG